LNWKRVVDDAPADVKRTNAVALLRSAGVKPVDMEGDTVVLAFKYSLHKENMEKPENQRVAERIVSHFLGRTCRVRCVYQSESNHLVEAAKKMGARVISVEEK
jgi:DNA polymerase-3 subunit gamma/tau